MNGGCNHFDSSCNACYIYSRVCVCVCTVSVFVCVYLYVCCVCGLCVCVYPYLTVLNSLGPKFLSLGHFQSIEHLNVP